MQNHSSFIIEPYRRKYLKEYFKRMSQDNLGVLYDDNVASVLKEQGFSITENPRSVYKVEKLYEALAKYEPKRSPEVNVRNKHIQRGLSLARACFAKPHDEDFLSLSPFTPEFIYSITSNRKGSAGLTAWGQTKAESYLRAFERGQQQIKGEKRPEPCIAFKRTQFDDKTRLVWGYPYAMTAEEGLFARPLIERFKLGNTPMAFGMSTGVLGSKLRVSSYHKKFAYSTDISSFDSSISSELIFEAFRILSSWYDLDQIEPITGIPYYNIYKQCIMYFIYTPIVMPDGNVYKGKEHGVPSGSYFTQIIDSIVNVIVVGAIADAFNLHVDKNDIYVLGDDVVFWSNHDVKLNDIANFATRLFGMKFNSAKSKKFHYYDPIYFLGRYWTKGVPSISEEDILIRMSQPETFRKYPKEDHERERQVRMLLLSYAAVYKEAYPIYLKCLDIRPRYNQSNLSMERFVYGYEDEQNVNPDYLSGLQRYRLKYLFSNSGRRYVPLALQFWK